MFTKEITFLSKEFEAITDENPSGFVIKPVKKIATFTDLDGSVKSQQKLHFLIILTYGSSTEGRLSSDGIYDMTLALIENLLVLNDSFTIQDKTLLLNDSGALFKLGMWLIAEKITPFFQTLNLS